MNLHCPVLPVGRYSLCSSFPLESKEWGKQLEELEQNFDSEDESPREEDTVSKQQDEKDATEQFADAEVEPKARKHRFGKCHDDLKDSVPMSQSTSNHAPTTVKLSEKGVLRKSYSDRSKS